MTQALHGSTVWPRLTVRNALTALIRWSGSTYDEDVAFEILRWQRRLTQTVRQSQRVIASHRFGRAVLGDASPWHRYTTSQRVFTKCWTQTHYPIEVCDDQRSSAVCAVRPFVLPAHRVLQCIAACTANTDPHLGKQSENIRRLICCLCKDLCICVFAFAWDFFVLCGFPVVVCSPVIDNQTNKVVAVYAVSVVRSLFEVLHQIARLHNVALPITNDKVLFRETLTGLLGNLRLSKFVSQGLESVYQNENSVILR